MRFIRSRLLVSVALLATVAGCSDPTLGALAPVSLPAGTAEVTVDGSKVDTTHHVRCSTEGAVTTIGTGDDRNGTTSTIDTAEGPAVRFAQIRDVAGFTGSYWAELDPEAEVTVSGRTYIVNGAANGFTKSNPSARISRTFSIRVAC